MAATVTHRPRALAAQRRKASPDRWLRRKSAMHRAWMHVRTHMRKEAEGQLRDLPLSQYSPPCRIANVLSAFPSTSLAPFSWGFRALGPGPGEAAHQAGGWGAGSTGDEALPPIITMTGGGARGCVWWPAGGRVLQPRVTRVLEGTAPKGRVLPPRSYDTNDPPFPFAPFSPAVRSGRPTYELGGSCSV